jgi:exosortase A-associated hydrolase 2
VVPFFLDVRGTRRFALLHEPSADAALRGGIVCVPPFAEELNKSRRAIAEAARAFAADGWTVLVVDLLGCGDSDGEFGDASWDDWVADVLAATAWLQARTGYAPLLWGVRAGALLAAEAAGRTSVAGLLLWQPVTVGEVFLTHFLRLRVAADAFAGGRSASTTATLRAQLQQGAALEVAGYTLTEKLVGPLAAQSLQLELPATRWVGWVEAGSGDDPQLGPGARRVVEAGRAAGVDVAAEAVISAPFWQTVEIDAARAFIAASARQLSGAPAAA